MSPTSDPSNKSRTQSAFNLTLVAVAGQVGCLTLFIVLAALFGGLWLDNRFDTRPMFTVGLMIVSVPVTLFTMFWVVRVATSRLQTSSEQNPANSKEDVISE
jgi:MFS-type transporter involved in bile tolerance (Atg22 family)